MFNLLPKDEKFYDELESLSRHVVNWRASFKSFPISTGIFAPSKPTGIRRGRFTKNRLCGLTRPLLRLWIAKTSSVLSPRCTGLLTVSLSYRSAFVFTGFRRCIPTWPLSRRT